MLHCVSAFQDNPLHIELNQQKTQSLSVSIEFYLILLCHQATHECRVIRSGYELMSASLKPATRVAQLGTVAGPGPSSESNSIHKRARDLEFIWSCHWASTSNCSADMPVLQLYRRPSLELGAASRSANRLFVLICNILYPVFN